MLGNVRDPTGTAPPCATVEWHLMQRKPASMSCLWSTRMPFHGDRWNSWSLVWQRRHDWLST